MSERARRLGRGSRLENLLADPWRKLAAIGLAVLLWLYLDSQITDTKDLEFRLRVTDPTESAQHDLSAGVTLALQLPRDQFTLVEFRDGLENQVISSVALTFRGPRHLINRLEENLGFTVTPTSEDLRKIENYFEFDARMIRARNPEFQSLLTGMTPRLVHAVVGRNEQRAVTVTPDLVDVKPPATTVDPDFAARWNRKNVEFVPSFVTLSGPERALRRALEGRELFVVDLSAVSSGTQDELQAIARLKPSLAEQGITMSPDLISTWRLRPSFKIYTIESVPVLPNLTELDEQERALLVIEPQAVPVALKVNSSLRAEIDLLLSQGRTLQEWLRGRLFVYAPIPKDANLEQSVVVQPMVFMTDQTLRKGIDWDATVDGSVTVRRRRE